MHVYALGDSQGAPEVAKFDTGFSCTHLVVAELEQDIHCLVILKVALELHDMLVVKRAVDTDLRHQLMVKGSKISGEVWEVRWRISRAFCFALDFVSEDFSTILPAKISPLSTSVSSYTLANPPCEQPQKSRNSLEPSLNQSLGTTHYADPHTQLLIHSSPDGARNYLAKEPSLAVARHLAPIVIIDPLCDDHWLFRCCRWSSSRSRHDYDDSASSLSKSKTGGYEI